MGSFGRSVKIILVYGAPTARWVLFDSISLSIPTDFVVSLFTSKRTGENVAVNTGGIQYFGILVFGIDIAFH